MTKAITYEFLAQKVADYFNEAIKEGGFDDFKDMASCYWWTPKDIKDEVNAIISEYDACIDEVDGTDVCLYDKLLSYRKFSSMWRKLLK